MKFDAIQVHSAPETLAEEIIRQIETGALEPGACLPSQRELARMFQVGLGSVREAIKILNVLGYIKVVRGKGTFIAEKAVRQEEAAGTEKAFEAVSLADLMRAREVVECACAGMAALEADEDAVERLMELTRAMEVSFRDRSAFYEIDFDFHIAVAEAANNKALLEIVKLLVDRAHNHIGFMDKSLGISVDFNVERAVGTAREIARHIASGDADRAREEMLNHLGIVKWQLEKEFLGEPDDR